MDLGLAGRVYILTGATRGLGLATAECLVADAAHVVVSSRDPASVATAVERLNDAAGARRAAGVSADLRDPDTPALLVRRAAEEFGRLDGALISVGGPPTGTATSMSVALKPASRSASRQRFAVCSSIGWIIFSNRERLSTVFRCFGPLRSAARNGRTISA